MVLKVQNVHSQGIDLQASEGQQRNFYFRVGGQYNFGRSALAG